MGQAPTAIPEPNLSTESLSRLSRWQLLRRAVDHFWKKWSAKCLQRCFVISKWHHPTNKIKEEALVLISDELSAGKVASRPGHAIALGIGWIDPSRHSENRNVHLHATYRQAMCPVYGS